MVTRPRLMKVGDFLCLLPYLVVQHTVEYGWHVDFNGAEAFRLDATALNRVLLGQHRTTRQRSGKGKKSD